LILKKKNFLYQKSGVKLGEVGAPQKTQKKGPTPVNNNRPPMSAPSENPQVPKTVTAEALSGFPTAKRKKKKKKGPPTEWVE